MKILIVDDHPLIVSSYIAILDELFRETSFLVAHTGKEANKTLLQNMNGDSQIDLAIIDERIPTYENEKIFSGSDIGAKIRRRMPNCKVMIITGYSEALLLYNIRVNVKPNGIIVKSDMSISSLKSSVLKVFTGDTYYSTTVIDGLDKIRNYPALFDHINRKILLMLQEGCKLQDIGGKLFMSTSAIQKRLYKLKVEFEAMDINELLIKATQQNFI